MQTLSLVSDSIGQLYCVPAHDWTQVQERVDLVVQVQNSPLADLVRRLLPGFPALLSSCTNWKQSTLPALRTQAQAVADYAATAISNFTALNQAVKTISDETGSVPDALKQQTLTLLQQLASDTVQLNSNFGAVSSQLLTFWSDNVAVDAQIAAYQEQLGQLWPPIQASLAALEQATGLVTGEWQALANDLTTTLASPIDVTMPFLEGLNLDAALMSWRNVQMEANAFPTVVDQ
jgi:hypothetical protein